MKKLSKLLVLILWTVTPSLAMAKTYNLIQATTEAQQRDPWLQGSLYQQESLSALSMSALTLPDPFISIGIANIPVDGFDLQQEAMTQLKVGITQMFPRGSTRALTQQKLQQLSMAQPFARMDRQAMVMLTVAHLWLDAYRSQQTIGLIEKDRGLFEHLVDVAESSYTTASGKTRQKDLIRAQLELTRLEDRLTVLRQMRDTQITRLSEWLSSDIELSSFQNTGVDIQVIDPLLVTYDNQYIEQLTHYLTHHPKVLLLEQKISAGDTEVKIAKQGYKPQWGINASYAYRDNEPMGNDRSDFASVGLSFDVPVFTSNRQDKQVVSASARHEAVKTERALILRQLKSGFETAKINYQRLLERQALYKNRLLKEISEQAEASLTAYTHDDGDFAEVVRSRIAQLNAYIDSLNIDVDIQKSIAQLNYFIFENNTKTEQSTNASDTGRLK